MEVWFDQSELRGGDAWDQKIRNQIQECALFLPLISMATQTRLEGYFRIEWKLAAQRTYAMAEARPFLIPVVIDATRDAEAHVPPEFKAVQWARMAKGEPAAAFVERVQALLACGLVAGIPDPLAGRGGFAEQKAGDRIGHYKLLAKVGEGGCGIVWRAEQEQPVHRRVALKVIKLGMDTKEVIGRFEAERQALAMMDHPNIAKVFDAGTTDAGRPYFVMELVQGVPITTFCDEKKLPTAARLELFIQVCHAVQHAHQKGIIHRDIKPSNILVALHDDKPAPKVIDFGIAKATAGRLTDQTLYTAVDQFIGTPAYMSPEQAQVSAIDIDTRSDIYSLGVLLYELLTGRTPFDAKSLLSAGLDEIRRIIREVDPPRPSTRLKTMTDGDRSTIAKHRCIVPTQLSTLLRGDLDWIVMRCLEKDRARRYETANGLAMDILRHKCHEPVAARPPSTAYLVQRLIRRHRFGFAAGVAIFGVVSVGAIVSTWQAVRARRAELEQIRLREAAQAAQANEKTLRIAADAQKLAARQRAYAADMNLVQQSLGIDNIGRAKELLYAHVPPAGERDLRGWEWRYLWQFCRPEFAQRLCENGELVLSLSASFDGAWVAAGFSRHDWLLWDVRTGTEFRPQVGDGRYLAFSPREPLIALTQFEAATAEAPARTIVVLWNVTTRQVVERLEHPGVCYGLRFTDDGQKLITFAISPSGKLAAQNLNSTQLRVVDLESGKTRWTVPGAEERVAAIAFSPDEKILASGSAYTESNIKLWNVVTGREIGRLDSHRAWVSALVFWPDGKTLASAGADQTIKLWDLATRQCVRSLHGHKTEIFRLTLLPDRKTLASGGKDGAVYLWDVLSGKHPSGATSVPEPVSAWSFSPDGQSVVTIGRLGEVAEWSEQGFQEKRALFPLHAFNRNALRFSADVSSIAIGFPNGTVQVWDVARRTMVTEVKIGTGSCYPEFFFAGNNRLVTSESRSNSYYDVDLRFGGTIAFLEGLAHGGRSSGMVAMSPDETRCVAVEIYDGEALMREMASGRITRVGVPSKQVRNVAFSPDGRLVAAASASPGGFVLWEAATMRELAHLTGFLQGCHSVAFSPDNRRLAVAGGGREALTLWDLESRNRLLTLPAPGSVYDSTAFSPDGNILGSSNTAGMLSFWHAPSWQEIAEAEKAQAAWIYRPTPAVRKTPPSGPKADESNGSANPVQTGPPVSKNAAPKAGPSAPSGTATSVATPVAPSGHPSQTTAAEVTDESSRLAIALKTLAIRKQSLGPEDPLTLLAMSNLGVAYNAERKYAEAVVLTRDVLEIERRNLGADAPTTLGTMHNLGVDYQGLGKLPEAATHYLDTLAIEDRALGPENSLTIQTMENLSAVLLALRRYAEAEPLCRRLVEAHTKSNIAWRTAFARSRLGDALRGLQRYSEAEPLLVAGFEQLSKATIPASNRAIIRSSANTLVQLYTDWKQPEKAAEWKQKLDALRHAEAGDAASRTGDFAKAAEEYREAARLAPNWETALNSFAWLRATAPVAAVRDGAAAITAARKACELTAWKNPFYIDTLAAAHAEAGEFDSAVEFQRKALDLLAADYPARNDWQARLTLYRDHRPFRQPERTPARQ